MSDEKRKVLEMLEAGKISREDADRLLEALGDIPETGPAPRQENWEKQIERETEAGIDRVVIEAQAAAEQGRIEAEKAREEAEKARIQAEVDRAFLPATEGAGEQLRGAVEEARRALEGAVRKSALQEAGEALGEAARQAAEAVGGSVPHLTLHPDLPEIPDIPEPPEMDFEPMPATGTPYDYPRLGSRVESLTIDWVNGPVEIRRGEEEVLKVTEYASRPLKDGEMLELDANDGEVTIRFSRERSFWRNFGMAGFTKHLVVELPRSLERLEELTVKNVSGNVYVNGLEGEDFSISSTSGKIFAANLQVEDLKLNSVSGKVQAESVAAEDLHVASTTGKVEVTGFSAEDAAFTTVSGSVQAMGQSESVTAKTTSGSAVLRLTAMPDEVKMNSVSGKAALTLPDSSGGFTVKYNSTSGSFHCEFPLSGSLGRKSGTGTYAGGETEICMNTMSGSIELCKA